MHHTKREIEAATQLGRAMLELLTAVGEGNAERQQQSSADRRLQEQTVRQAVSPVPRAPGLLGLPEAAEFLGVSTRTLHALTVPRGIIPVVRLSRRVLYSMDDLYAAVQRLKVRPKSQPGA